MLEILLERLYKKEDGGLVNKVMFILLINSNIKETKYDNQRVKRLSINPNLRFLAMNSDYKKLLGESKCFSFDLP